MHLAEEEIEAVVDTGASALLVGKFLPCRWGIWERARRVEVRQGYGSFLEGNFVVNTLFKVMDCSSVMCKFTIDAEGLDIGNGDMIWQLSWLRKNRFLVNTQDRC